MKLSRNEVVLIYLTSVDIPGKELIYATQRVLPQVLELAGHPPIGEDELTQRVMEVYEARSELILKTYALDRKHDPRCVVSVRASLFREHLFTYVQVDTDKIGRWDLIECIVTLPWFEPYLVVDDGKERFTTDRVLDLDFVGDYKETITKREVDEIVSFLNRSRRP